MKLAKVFLAGMIISFAGSLPLGMLNVAALQLSLSDGYGAAFWFVAGCALVEMIYVRASLVVMDRILQRHAVFKALKWVSFFILLALALNALTQASRGAVEVHSLLSWHGLHPFVAGVMLMAVNPMQVPFWLGWNTILYSRNILVARQSHNNIYPLGIGLGSLLGSAVFIFGGRLLAGMLGAHQNLLNWVLGLFFLMFAAMQLRKIVRERRGLEARVE